MNFKGSMPLVDIFVPNIGHLDLVRTLLQSYLNVLDVDKVVNDKEREE